MAAARRARRRAPPTPGFTLRERLTVYPEYVRRGEPWLDPRRAAARRGAGRPADGLAREDVAAGRAAVAGAGRRLRRPSRAAPTCTPPSTPRAAPHDRREDFDDVYGDWDALREQGTAGRPASARRPACDADVRRRAAPPRRTTRPGCTDAEALALFARRRARSSTALAPLADDLRRDAVGDDVTYVVNRNINFTNVCYTGCRFCAFAQRRTDADAYTLSLDQVGDRAEQAWAVGATEVCMQGGIHPDLPGTAYFDLAREVKQRVPDMHVHAFCPMEVVNGASRTGLSIRDWLTAAKEAGLDTIPGTAAEILDDDVRWVLTKGKLPTATWIEVVTTAHELGIRSSSTMMYGHVDNPAHWLGHLRLLRRIQERDRRLHRVRAAAVRPHQRADLPRRASPGPGPTAAREPRRARDGAPAAARRTSTTSRPRGSSSASTARARCCAAASTTSAAR